MPARTPEELDRLFARSGNAGDLEALVALYEPAAGITQAPGTIVYGEPAIRQVLTGLLARQPTFAVEAKTVAQTGDIALTSSTWSLTVAGPDGGPAKIIVKATTVCRRQRDGTWRYLIDHVLGMEHG
ncbi:MAG TPA: SgcJ/EcaC family oxidoreductase [Dehalococcoidia bacterium]|nr:SgcJ/EcaC family oxidoreductase [Dehalococcoidia bacterium]